MTTKTIPNTVAALDALPEQSVIRGHGHLGLPVVAEKDGGRWYTRGGQTCDSQSVTEYPCDKWTVLWPVVSVSKPASGAVEAALWAWIESATEGVTRENIAQDTLNRNRPRAEAAVRAALPHIRAMLADEIGGTGVAREVAESRWPTPNMGDPLPGDWHDIGMASGFVLGAQWARARVRQGGAQ